MFKEKLHKKLVAALSESEVETPTPLQAKCLSRINAGADIIVEAPEGSGKSTLIVITCIQKLQRAIDEPPRAIILVADKEKALAMQHQFKMFGKNTDLRFTCVLDGGDLDEESGEIYEGTDVVIGTAKRIVEIYFSRTFNLNKIKFFAIDDAEMIIKNSWLGQMDRLALSLPKCQRIAFTNDFNEKVEKMINKLLVAPQFVEFEPEA